VDIDAASAPAVRKSGAAPAHGVRDGDDGVVLADDPFVKVIFESDELGDLALHQAGDRNPGQAECAVSATEAISRIRGIATQRRSRGAGQRHACVSGASRRQLDLDDYGPLETNMITQ
jgi:hypothetical protein